MGRLWFAVLALIAVVAMSYAAGFADLQPLGRLALVMGAGAVVRHAHNFFRARK
jgi:hypothetical protein